MTRYLTNIAKGVCFALCALTFFCSYTYAEQDAESRKFLLSDEFFSDFYGTESDDLMTFRADNEALELPFASDRDIVRASLDSPLNLDCSKYSAFEIIYEVDKPAAIGYPSLYFHSKQGWYSYSNPSKRNIGNKTVLVFGASSFRTEGSPAGLDQIDAVRLSFWRGSDVNAKVTLRSFKGSTTPYAIVSVNNQRDENSVFVRGCGEMLARCGLSAERLDAETITGDGLKRYLAVFLPISGELSPSAIDALGEYLDAGGFLFACYNIPSQLMEKMGVESHGFVKCASEGISLGGMAFEDSFIKESLAKGFTVPKTLRQNSWNFYKVQPSSDWEASRDSSLLDGRNARVIAYWTLEDGTKTEYPAMIASPSGVYCSHVLLMDDLKAKKEFFEAFIVSAHPQVAKNFVRSEWLSIFGIGLSPDVDVTKANKATLNYLEKELTKRRWTLNDAARIMDYSQKNFKPSDYAKFKDAVLDIKASRIDAFCSSRKSNTVEGRLWWEHSGCGIYPGDWDRTMKELSEAGFNGVIPNMLWGGNAYYKSEILPVDPKVEKYGDQIELAAAAGKKYGVEVHAWMVCFNASNSPKWFIDKMRDEGRLQYTLDGEEKPWLCPSHPENRALQLAALEEVAEKYDVDGVHFDYIRFPDGSTCYCDGCKERFTRAYKEKTGKTLENFPESVQRDEEIKKAFQDWRCNQITALVRDVHRSLKAKRPEIKISAAVFTGYPGTKASVGQDWGLWIDEGLLDFVCPMNYTSDPATFANHVKRQLPYTKGKTLLYPGIGMTATGISMKGEEVALQADIAKKLGAQGFTIFNLSASTAAEALPALKKGVTSKPAKAPHSK
jgi:uncharacterized lipoprotein YddW (UPF0748 family)